MSRIRHQHFVQPTISAEMADAIFPDLFSPPAVAVDTSLAAAARIQPHTARVREAIYLWLKTQGARGATAGELESALALSGSTVRPRLRELQGDAPWAKGKLPVRIRRLSEKRDGMRVYQVLAG
jgi:hypothetical protein